MQDGTKITIKNEEYIFIKNYKENDRYRQSLNRLTQKTYGFDFEEWYRGGYWRDKYRPYSLLRDNEVVANISVNPIDFLINGVLAPTLQIGTVMTEVTYRNQGLSRELMNIVLNEYHNYDCIYLYANDSVLEFYPKFGFEEAKEYIYTKQLQKKPDSMAVRNLNMQEESDKELVTRLVTNSRPISKYSMVGNPGLIMFYLTSFLSENIYYVKEMDMVAVAEYEGNKLLLTDIFIEQKLDLDVALHALSAKETEIVSLGFTPLDTSNFTCELLKEEGTTFFVKGKNLPELGRFPVLSHA